MEFWYCFFYLTTVGIGSFFLGRLLPYEQIREDRFPFSAYEFEHRGSVYERLGIRHWYNRVPDMSRIFPGLIPQKRLDGTMSEKLPLLIKETCIAELIHAMLAVAALYCLVIWDGIGGVIVTALFELGNLPYILIQRYNRPKLMRLYQRARKREERTERENFVADSV